MRSGIILIAVSALLMIGHPALAQGDWIGVYGDSNAETCRINDGPAAALVPVYVIQQGTTPSIGSRFMVEWSGGVAMTFISAVVNPSFLSIGSIETGIEIAYITCQTNFPLNLVTVNFLGFGTTPRCETIEVVGSPSSASGQVEIVDCSQETMVVPSSPGVVNPSLHCVCTGEPEVVPLTTVTTTPAGRDITVDGDTYQAPQVFQWEAGTSHDIGVPSPQGPVDSVFTFAGWSDGGGQTHSIVAPAHDTTFTATLDLSPRFTIATEPSGLEIVADAISYTAPKNFYWLGGTLHNVSAPSPQAGVDSAYVFVSWSDGGAISHTVTAPGVDTSLTATFTTIPNDEPGFIGLYSDAGGSSCELMDNSPQLQVVYVIHRGFGGATQSRFRVRSDGGFGWTYLGESHAVSTTGDTQAGLQAFYGGCQAGDLFIGQISYLSNGNLDPCHFLEVTPDPTAASGLVEVRDCSNNLLNANSSRLYVNPDGGCQCGERVLPGRDVVVTTEPPGLTVTIDGTPYVTPQQFVWLESSTHTVDAPVQQSSMMFLSWNDGGDRVRTVEVEDSDLNLIATYYGASAGGEAIGIYADEDAGSCQLLDTVFGVVTAYVVHTDAIAAYTSQFALSQSPDMNMTLLSAVVNPNYLSLGDITTGITITYLSCQRTFPLTLATLSYFAQTSSSPCSYIAIVPDPAVASGQVEVVGCAYTVRPVAAGRAIVNGDGSCVCGPPVGGPTQATVTTTPPGLAVTVDSVSYTSPHDFQWDAGTTHTISVDEWQTYTADSIAVFSYWSDGGARTHEVTMPSGSVTYRATHDLQRGVTSGVGDGGIPSVVVLRQNAPNPFNPTTRIEFSLPNERYVRVHVFDVRGRLVRRLHEGPAPSGYTSLFWNGVNERGQAVGSGVYFYRLDAGSDTVTKKMVLLK